MFDMDCQCGRDNCWNTVGFRFGPAFYENGRIEERFYIEAVGDGATVEVMLDHSEAWALMRFLLSRFFRINKIAHRIRVLRYRCQRS